MVAIGGATASTTAASEAFEDRSERGLQGVGQGGRSGGWERQVGVGVVRGGARPALRAGEHRLEGAPPQPLEHHAVVVLATRRSATLHYDYLT